MKRQEWQPILRAEVQRWSAKSVERIVSELSPLHAYEVHVEGRTLQVEVELLENTEKYIHVMVAVDDGSLPASLSPLTETFILRKDSPHAGGVQGE
jgi:hypothetical protein